MPKIEKSKILEFIQDIAPKEVSSSLTPKTKLFGKGVLDSMNILHLIGFVEKHLERRLTDAEVVMKNFESVDAIGEYFFND